MGNSIALVDLGSNSVRLVIYQQVGDMWRTAFSEKASCGLGKTLQETGALNPEGIICTRQTLSRFKKIAHAYGIDHIQLVATAAMREASDGDAFAASLINDGYDLRILSGEEEAQYSAKGVLACHPEAKGFHGDLGGSSLELTDLSGDTAVSLPCGVLSSPVDGSDIKGWLIAQLPWVSHQVRDDNRYSGNHTFHAVGGSWRAVAKYWMEVNNYPLPLTHWLTIPADSLRSLRKHMEKHDVATAKPRPAGIARARLETITYATDLLIAICDLLNCNTITFSDWGVRQGYIADTNHFPRDRFTLLAQQAGGDINNPIWDWQQHLYPQATPQQQKIAAIACSLYTIGSHLERNERGVLALQHIINTPIYAANHQERAMLGLMLYASYSGANRHSQAQQLATLLDETTQQFCTFVGFGIRTAKAVCAHQLSLLHGYTLMLEEESPTIKSTDFIGEIAEKRLRTWQKMWLHPEKITASLTKK